MRYSVIILLLLVALGSCIEELDEVEPGFEKLYGYNLKSRATGITPISGGNYLIYGWTERTIMGDEGQNAAPVNKDVQMPFLVKIDQNGNEIATRTFPINQLEYSLATWAKSNNYSFQIDKAIFNNIIEMNNGNLFTIFYAYNDFSIHAGYMILDKNLDVENIQLLDDSEIEFKETDFVTRISGGELFLMNSSANNEIMIISNISFHLDSTFSFPTSFFYSMYRISTDGTILNVYDYDVNAHPPVVYDITTNAAGNLIVLGQVNFSGSELFIHEIDLNNGELLKEHILSNGIPSRRPWQILATEEGYVMQITEYHNNIESHIAYSSFYDQDFNFIDSISYPKRQNGVPFGFRDFILNSEGGFYSLSFSPAAGMTIYKLNRKGNEIWRREFEADTPDGGSFGNLLEARDGGVLCVRAKEFNSTGYKIKIIKLDPNGNL